MLWHVLGIIFLAAIAAEVETGAVRAWARQQWNFSFGIQKDAPKLTTSYQPGAWKDTQTPHAS